jgi:hypothetical protein
MRQNYNFLIESERSGHTLFFNGHEIATFATLDAAESAANKVAGRAVPGATLKFALDFKWTLSDLEIRAATLDWEGADANQSPAAIGSDRELVKEGASCG